jgi:general secretion pathway protein G
MFAVLTMNDVLNFVEHPFDILIEIRPFKHGRIDMSKRRRRNAGFTLLELLLVMAILVVLASLSTFAVLGMQRNAYSRAAATEIQNLKSMCQAFKLHVGRFPATLDDLYLPPSGMSPQEWGGPYVQEPIKGDPWKRPYNYSADELNDRVIITSNGPDGQQGTADDIPGSG